MERVALVGVEHGPDVEEAHARTAGDDAFERLEGKARALHHSNAGGKGKQDALLREVPVGAEVEGLQRVEQGRRLRDDDEPPAEVGQRAGDPLGDRGVEDGQPRGALEHAAHDGCALGIEEVMVGIRARQRHDQRDLGPARQAQREGPDTVGVEGMDHRGPERVHLGLDGRLGPEREIPDVELGAARAKAPSHPRDGHGVAAHRGERERREQRHARRHRPRAYGHRRLPSRRRATKLPGPESLPMGRSSHIMWLDADV